MNPPPLPVGSEPYVWLTPAQCRKVDREDDAAWERELFPLGRPAAC